MASQTDLITRGRLGDILLASGIVSEDQLQGALRLAAQRGVRLGQALVELGSVDDATLTWALGVQFDLSFVELSDAMIDWQLVRQYPIAELRALGLLPLSFSEGHIRAVVADPTPDDRAERIRRLFGGTPVVLQLAAEEDILEGLDHAEGLSSSSFHHLTERDRTSSHLERWIAALSSGELEQLVVRPASNESSSLSVTLSPALTEHAANLSAADLQSYADRLGEYFTPTMHLAGGFMGIRPRRPGLRTFAVRAMSLTGLQGHLLAFQAVPVDLACRPASKPVLFAGPSQHVAKTALFHCLSEAFRDTGRETRGLFLSLEAHADTLSNIFFQVEVPSAEARVALVTAAAATCKPAVLLLELPTGERGLAALSALESQRQPAVYAVGRAHDEASAQALGHACAEVVFVPDSLGEAVEVVWPWIRGRFEQPGQPARG
jgi:hypothetical protein